jgi:prepilin-type N-terminal cleavage/methylation domain-containing protein
MKKNKGFTLIELMIVVAIIAIIAAIAIPSLLQMKMKANEGSAISSLRTICTAEMAWQNSEGAGDFGSLNDLSTAVPPYIDEELGAGTKSGYTFTVATVPEAAGTAATFTGTAVPVTDNASGKRKFFVDQTGVIRQTTDGSDADETSDPI